MEKKLYVSPDAKFISFASEDIMQASQNGNQWEKDPETGWGDWEDSNN